MRLTTLYLGSTALALSLVSCTSLKLENVNFGWPVESVLTVSNTNMVEDGRNAVTFSVAKLAAEEFKDSTALIGAEIRLIRNTGGYYFVTGKKFKNVYVFYSNEHELRLQSRIAVEPLGLKDPALNQRAPYIELLDGPGFRRLLTNDDIAEGASK